MIYKARSTCPFILGPLELEGQFTGFFLSITLIHPCDTGRMNRNFGWRFLTSD